MTAEDETAKQADKHERKLWLAILLLGLAFLIALTHNTTFNAYMLSTVSCDGIEHFYSGNSFFYDVASAPNRTTYNDTWLPRIPEDYFKYGGNCQSLAVTTMCLCKKYNMTCQLYYNDYPAHVGVMYEAPKRLEVTTQVFILS